MCGEAFMQAENKRSNHMGLIAQEGLYAMRDVPPRVKKVTRPSIQDPMLLIMKKSENYDRK